MHALVQGVILGVLTGGVYALMASGQTLIFGIMKVINLAQGAMVIMGAYLSYQLFVSFGLDPFLAIPITTIVMFGVGVAVQLLFLRPLRRDDKVRAEPAGDVRGRTAHRGLPQHHLEDHLPKHQHRAMRTPAGRSWAIRSPWCGCGASCSRSSPSGCCSCC